MDGIFHGKISSPSEASWSPDFLDEAPHAALVALPILKAFAVAPEWTLHQIHVNGMPHEVVAASSGLNNGIFYGLTGFPKGTGHVHLDKVGGAVLVIFSHTCKAESSLIVFITKEGTLSRGHLTRSSCLPPIQSESKCDVLRCLLLLLRISSAHHQILGFPIANAY